MKNTKMMAKMFTVMLFIAASLTTSNATAQTKTKKSNDERLLHDERR